MKKNVWGEHIVGFETVRGIHFEVVEGDTEGALLATTWAIGMNSGLHWVCVVLAMGWDRLREEIADHLDIIEMYTWEEHGVRARLVNGGHGRHP